VASIVLRIEPDLCGPVSVGTVGVIQSLQNALGLGLDEAADYVNRCVFDGETVEIPAPSVEDAERAIRLLAQSPRTSAHLGAA
jgi:hypothetical protein